MVEFSVARPVIPEIAVPSSSACEQPLGTILTGGHDRRPTNELQNLIDCEKEKVDQRGDVAETKSKSGRLCRERGRRKNGRARFRRVDCEGLVLCPG